MGNRGDVRLGTGGTSLTVGDDWPGAWDPLDFERPEDWRDVDAVLAWDLAATCAVWVHLEAWHQDAARRRSLRDRVDLVTDVLRRDLPYLLDVGPSAPEGREQPQLPLLFAEDPGLERLSERPGELSWRTYFALPLHLRSELILHRARPRLRAQWLGDRGRPGAPAADDAAFEDALRATFEPGVAAEDVARWTAAREAEDRMLVDRLGGQVALQLECVLRDQPATVLPLVEEGLALHLEDAALGAALNVVTDGDEVVGLCLVSHDGRPRAVVATTGGRDTPLRDLVAAAGR